MSKPRKYVDLEEFRALGGSCIPMAVTDEDEKIVERMIITSIAGMAGGNWPQVMTLLREVDGVQMRRQYVLKKGQG